MGRAFHVGDMSLTGFRVSVGALLTEALCDLFLELAVFDLEPLDLVEGADVGSRDRVQHGPGSQAPARTSSARRSSTSRCT